MPDYRKKLIEVALPLPEINDASAYDKMPGIGPHPKGIHHWWARLPLPTARAVLFASIVDDPSAHPERFPTEEDQNLERERLFGILRRMMQKKLHDHPEIYAEAQQEMLKNCDGKLPPVFDPFAGGGSIPLEASRLGFQAYAADLNPVAVLLNKCNLELVPRWADTPPINPQARGTKLFQQEWKGSRGLAEDVRYYGYIILQRAIDKVGHLYPRVKLPKMYGGQEVQVIAWLWTRTVKCPNPACGARTPLVRSFWLAKKKPHFIYAQPIIDHKRREVRFEIRTEGEPEKETTSKKGARCLFCEKFIKKGELRDLSMRNGIKEIPLAIVCHGPSGRIYLPAEATEVQQTERPDLPHVDQAMTNDRRWFSPPLYGLPNFSDVFTPRQMTAMATLSDFIKEIRAEVLRDAKAAGVDENNAGAYTAAVVTFLALALDRCADFNNSLCRWGASNEKVMSIFGRQAIPMVWDFAEANILGDSVGSWSTRVEYVTDCIEVIAPYAPLIGEAHQLDAATELIGAISLLVSTDPPYYDNIGYAALSDFFYVWLRRTIGDLYPEMFNTILIPKTWELTAAPERFGGDKRKAKEHFETGFRKAFTSLRSEMDPRFPLTVYYAFKQEDEDTGNDEDEDGAAVSNGIDRTTGWETLLEALLRSGFQITATWPVRASQKWRMVAAGTNALGSYIVLACRPRPEDSPQSSRREFLNELKRELPVALRHLQQGNIAPVDLAQAAIGPGMAVLSRYSRVMESSGKAMTVRTALLLINETLDEVLAEQEGEFDADTRWALAWFEQHGMEDGEFGVAETLSKAKNTAINGLVQDGMVLARGGKVKLKGRNEMRDHWDPATDKRLTVWEATQYLIRALDQKGEQGAAELLRMLGGLRETARDLAYRLYIICERKKWAQEALAYNSLVIAWPEITKLTQAALGQQTTMFDKP